MVFWFRREREGLKASTLPCSTAGAEKVVTAAIANLETRRRDVMRNSNQVTHDYGSRAGGESIRIFPLLALNTSIGSTQADLTELIPSVA
jgi:hypothetical protein